MTAFPNSAALLLACLALARLACAEEGIRNLLKKPKIRPQTKIYVPWQTKGGKQAAPSGKRSGGRHKRMSFDPTGLSVDAKDGQNVDIAYESGKGGWEVAGVGVY